ncbi:RNA-directed DNA polymerase [Lutibacter sp.]
MKNILELSHDEAKEFFLKSDSYTRIELPIYFDFSELLKSVSSLLNNSRLSDFYVPEEKSSNYENVNYFIYSNKDGKYSWRPLQIINPAIYVELVHVITEENNWEFIKKRFNEFQSIQYIRCMSIPTISTSKRKDKAEQIFSWWEKIEQESLKLVLEFNYVIHADITNCYGSIYTHTIPWALYGKEYAKVHRDRNLLGNRIDNLLQSMNYGQTNGIPQGSVLSDFIAEIILGHIDMKLFEILASKKIKGFKILRYRDDYRIFSKELHVAEIILKLLSEILLEFNFKLNDKKTRFENDLILSAVKEDKINWMKINKSFSSIQKELLILYKFSQNFPNSGSLVRWLKNIYEKIEENKKVLNHENREVLISILAEIMFKNPRVIPVCVAIISLILDELPERITFDIVENIKEKFLLIPNTGLLEIWLQRLVYPINPNYDFDNSLCKKVKGVKHIIWNIDWLQDGSLKKTLTGIDFINREELKNMNFVLDKNEFDPFTY